MMNSDEFWNIWRYKENNQKQSTGEVYVYLSSSAGTPWSATNTQIAKFADEKQMQSQELDHLEPGKIGLNTAKYFKTPIENQLSIPSAI